MALFVNQNDNRSQLQERLAAELQEKAKKRAEMNKDLPDGITDSAYLKDTKVTTSLAWLWIVIALFAVGALVFFIVLSTK
jgi:hypothetical protein